MSLLSSPDKVSHRIPRKKCKCQKQTGSSIDTNFHLIWGNLRMRHSCIVLQITQVTELLFLTHKCHKLEWMRRCCTWTCCAVAGHPSKKGCTPVLKWRDPPTSRSAQSLTWIRYSELRVTETLAPQAQTARLATKRKTPNLQARSHRLFTPERPSHKRLIKSAFFQSWHIFHITAHCRLVTKPLLVFLF